MAVIHHHWHYRKRDKAINNKHWRRWRRSATVNTSFTIFLLGVFGLRMSGWKRWCFYSSSVVSRWGAEASAGVTFGFGWGAAATMLGLAVRVISVLQTCIPSTNGMAGLWAWRHGRGTRVRRQVLGGWHGHETHPEVSAKRSQVFDFSNSGWWVILAGAAVGKRCKGAIRFK